MDPATDIGRQLAVIMSNNIQRRNQNGIIWMHTQEKYWKNILRIASKIGTTLKGKSSAYFRQGRQLLLLITKTRLFKYIENFTTNKWKLSDEKLW